MKALGFARNKEDRSRLNRKCQSMLDQAERIKVARKKLTSSAEGRIERDIGSQHKRVVPTPRVKQALSTKEKVILLESSRVNSFVFPPWESKPEALEFELKEGEGKYMYAANPRQFIRYG